MPRHGIHVLGGAMPEPIDFVLPFTQEEIKVVEEKLSAFLECDLPRRAAGGQIGGLRKNPGISQHARVRPAHR